jgi:alkanesulfonate monooxygenase SsuD/methylene tetrahydromethanopterin reductase-like flavin-dependent oxidoreductase (luciferase family)
VHAVVFGDRADSSSERPAKEPLMRHAVFYLLDYHPEVHGTEADVYQRVTDEIVQAEEWGFNSVWFTEHHFTNYGGIFPHPMMFCAAAAQRTKTIRFGLAVSLIPYHRPVRIAEDVAMLDIISGGRVDFGAGRGFIKWEHDNLGVPMEESRIRFQEGMDIIARAWSQEEFSYEGKIYKHHNVTVLPRPVQKPHPPIWVAGTRTPDSFQWIGEMSYNLMIVPFLAELESTDGLVGLYRKSLPANAKTDTFAAFMMYIHPNADEAVREGREYFDKYIGTHAAAVAKSRPVTPSPDFAHHAAGAAKMAKTTFEDLQAQKRILFGSPEYVAENLIGLARRFGITQVCCQFNFGGMPRDKVLRSMQLYHEKVMPVVNRALGGGE